MTEGTNLLVETLLGEGRREPDRAAVRWGDDVWTFGSLDALSARLARVLVADFSVASGDRVAVRVPTRPEVLALNVACARVGALYVPLNPAYTDPEVHGLLDDASPVILVGEGPRGRREPVVGLDELLERARTRPDRFEDRAGDEDTPAAILFTSGTTGRPKGAVLSQGNLVFGCTTLNRVWGIGRDDVLVHPLPLFHVHGLFVAAYCALAAGATMRLLPSFEVGAVLDALAEGTVMMGVPTHYTRLLADERLTAESVRGVRLFVSGSAPMRVSTHEAFTARTGHRILERYGTTETGMIASNPLDGERRVGTVGPALPGVEVRLAGTPPGRVEVRGPNVLSGYWNRPDQPARGPDGFFDTGDLGRLDADGYLEIVGRAKDLVITGGLNVYPKQVEQAIDALDGVEESAVVGLTDRDFGEVVVAVVVTRPGAELTADGIRAALREVLAPYKIPKRVVLAGALARNAMGKVEKARLRRALEEGTGPVG